ncbi:hypothetical protein PFICI_00341 [Pestalotiopsis fici W106-1]|uniref:Uncharacterized protein n=1 Tax=Pestalotiopsis fici (strain W106-1 / CGMCC3.15140) TaxID=1229662 RepID=W3XKD9_PESFW|nr:uncharacterized protein PFICI_00341 [Pestalotiopsis fici W106-1]ETS86513.1 hypothetical protein PFICI_00341 [Pestalotiopsis fici W106-1]
MSGAEVLGIISAVIAIVDGINQLYDGAKDATGLPEAFREVAARLPLIKKILESVDKDVRGKGRSNSSSEVKSVLVQAQRKASDLKKVFDKLIPLDNDSRKDRYIKLVRTLGKGNKVETLMLGLMTDMQLLVSKNGLDNATSQQVEELRKAFEERSSIKPSVANSELTPQSFTNNNHVGGTQANDNNGAVEAKLNQVYGSGAQCHDSGKFQHIERPETPPNPSSIIPFNRDKDFVPRGDILDRIHQACAIPGSRTALVGLGGVGRKSQLAIEYAHETRQRSSDTWVFWVHASNATRYEQSFRDIADHVKIPGRDDPNKNIFQLVRDWLRGGKNRKWRLILDNVDDASFLLDAPSLLQDSHGGDTSQSTTMRLVDYLPVYENGSILITSRNRGAALQLVEPSDIFPVEPMSQKEAEALIETKLGSRQDKDCVAQLAIALECMPLAIVQAAAYISRRAPQWSAQRYLEQFKQSDQRKAGLLRHEGSNLRRDGDAKNSILITWQISFDHIRQIRPSAADLLALMSFFDRQGIPESLLRDQRKAGDDESIGCSSAFDDDVLVLREYSFVHASERAQDFQMHRLVQLATRNWLQDSGSYEQWKQEFINRLATRLPNGEYVNWVTWQTLLPHARLASILRPETEAAILDWATVLHQMGWYCFSMGNGHEAERITTLAMETRIEILGRDDTRTLSTMGLVGLIYDLNGRWEAALKLDVEVCENREKISGPDHPDTLRSMNNLAETNQGQLEAAEELHKKALEIRKQKLGPDHPDTLLSMHNLAFTLDSLGRIDEAIPMLERCVNLREQVLGSDHPKYLSSLAILNDWKDE